MNYNNIFISIIFFFSGLSVLSNGILMINEKDKINFDNLSITEKVYVGCLVYTEIYMFIILIYNLVYYIYKFIFSCFSDADLTFSYNCYKALFIFSGLASHFYLIYVLIIKEPFIDQSIHDINIIFVSNFLLIIFLAIVFKFLKSTKKENKEIYKDVN